MLHLVERYITIGGEAPMAGRPVYIIRFSGCNLSCFYCDTKYNSEKNEELSVKDLIEIIREQTKAYPNLLILFTGGEPLLSHRQKLLLEIMKECADLEFYIETNGSFLIDPGAPNNCHYVMDWKSPSSGSVDSFKKENLERLNPSRDCLKFVVSQQDLPWLVESVKVCRGISPELPIFVSPQWGDVEPSDLVDLIIDNKLDIGLSLQIHKLIWPPEVRGV